MRDTLESFVVTFTGNRNIRPVDVRAALLAVHEKYPNSVWRTGMAYGLDLAVAEFAAAHDIPFEAHLPFESHLQVKQWMQSSRDRYFAVLGKAVRVFTHSHGFSMGAYQIRNVKMADGATVVVAFNRHKSGGTVNMIQHCQKSNILVIDGFSLSSVLDGCCNCGLECNMQGFEDLCPIFQKRSGGDSLDPHNALSEDLIMALEAELELSEDVMTWKMN